MTKPNAEQLAALNVRIAELMGWTRIDKTPEFITGSFFAGKRSIGGTPPRDKGKIEDEQHYEQVPDYTGSLDAIHEVEIKLLHVDDPNLCNNDAMTYERLKMFRSMLNVSAEAWQRAVVLDRLFSTSPIL